MNELEKWRGLPGRRPRLRGRRAAVMTSVLALALSVGMLLQPSRAGDGSTEVQAIGRDRARPALRATPSDPAATERAAPPRPLVDRAGMGSALRVATGPGSAPLVAPAGPGTTAPPSTAPSSSTSATTVPSTTASTAPTTAPSTTTTDTTPPTTAAETGPVCFQPAFRDDFNGTELGPNWRKYTTKGNHSPHAIRRAAAVSVGDGLLQITAANDAEGVLASGGLRHLGTQTYGRFSVRVRTDADMTNASSGVVLTWPASNDQPRDGENNLYETLKSPGSRRPFYSFIHEPFDDRADGVSQKRFVHDADATRWQVVTMEWTPSYLSVTTVGPDGSSGTQRIDETDQDLITDAGHFLSIQLDLFKGSFPDGRTVTMQVDWVEISSYCGG